MFKIEVFRPDGRHLSTFYRDYPRDVRDVFGEFFLHRFELYRKVGETWQRISCDELDR